MKTSSCKSKARRLQNLVRSRVLSTFIELHPDDIKCSLMGETGMDLKLSPVAKKVFPFSVEAKNTEKLNIWSAIKQAENNTQEGTSPVVVFSRNRNPEPYVVLTLTDFLKLARGNSMDKPLPTCPKCNKILTKCECSENELEK